MIDVASVQQTCRRNWQFSIRNLAGETLEDLAGGLLAGRLFAGRLTRISTSWSGRKDVESCATGKVLIMSKEMDRGSALRSLQKG